MDQPEDDAALHGVAPARRTRPEDPLLELRHEGQHDDQEQGEERSEPGGPEADEVDVGRVTVTEKRHPRPVQNRQRAQDDARATDHGDDRQVGQHHEGSDASDDAKAFPQPSFASQLPQEREGDDGSERD